MTRAEREAAAVRDHDCPRCKERRHFRCMSYVRAWRGLRLKHPHQERIALVQEETEERK